MSFKLITLATLAAFMASPGLAGGGNAIGKVAGDVTDLFNKAAKPEIPPRTPEATLEYDTPEYVPGGSTTLSTGQVHGVTPPNESVSSTFNRSAADAPASDGLTDTFNYTARGN